MICVGKRRYVNKTTIDSTYPEFILVKYYVVLMYVFKNIHINNHQHKNRMMRIIYYYLGTD